MGRRSPAAVRALTRRTLRVTACQRVQASRGFRFHPLREWSTRVQRALKKSPGQPAFVLSVQRTNSGRFERRAFQLVSQPSATGVAAEVLAEEGNVEKPIGRAGRIQVDRTLNATAKQRDVQRHKANPYETHAWPPMPASDLAHIEVRSGAGRAKASVAPSFSPIKRELRVTLNSLQMGRDRQPFPPEA